MGTTNILDLNNRVSKLAESYPADKVMMSDGVTSVEDALNVSAINGTYNLESYTSVSNLFECPADGYARFIGTASTVATLHMMNKAGNDNYTLAQTKDLYVSIYLRKGAKIFIQQAITPRFFPLG